MSKMTQRRMTRRASRKINESERKLRRKAVEVAALSSNLKEAFKAITRQRDRIRELTGQTPAVPAAT
jgi:hypothetical protein